MELEMMWLKSPWIKGAVKIPINPDTLRGITPRKPKLTPEKYWYNCIIHSITNNIPGTYKLINILFFSSFSKGFILSNAK